MHQSILFNFRIPVRLKERFERACNRKNVSMTSQLNILISDHISADQEQYERVHETLDEPLPFFICNKSFGR